MDIKAIVKRLNEVNRDIEGMMRQPLSKKNLRELMEARRYRRELIAQCAKIN